MNYSFIADKIYSLLKENNVDFKEFYLVEDKDMNYCYPTNHFDFYLIIIGNKSENDLTREETKKISDITFDIDLEFDTLTRHLVFTEEEFNSDILAKNSSMRSNYHYVA